MPDTLTNSPDAAPMRVLFLCTHNSSRSQMAEGLLRTLGGARYESLSAGTHPTAVNPLAKQVMSELGIDLSGHSAKSLDAFRGQTIDLVVTVCGEAAEECPAFPGARQQVHWGFEDPTKATGSEAERLAVFRRVRDGIAERIQRFVSEQ